ncbi:ferrochelatase-2, chloroplastic-like protein [Tanacetum coccineum]
MTSFLVASQEFCSDTTVVFAYDPISKGNSQTRGIAVGTNVSKRFNLDKWPIPVFGSASKNNRVNDDKNMDAGNLYLRLLQAYLRFFVPFTDLNAQSPYRTSLLHYSSGYDSLVLENAESVLAELPPTPGLAEVVNVLVKAPKSKDGYASIGGGSPLRKITDEHADALKMALEAKEVPANVYVAMRYWYPFTEEAIQQMLLQVLFADHIDSDLLWDEMPSASNKFALDMQFLAYFCITQAVKSKAVGDAKIVARAPIAVTVRSTIRRLREQTELDLMVSLSIVIAKPL